MDDARALVLLPALGADERDRVRERPARVPGAGMDDNAGWLVDDEEMVVLVRDRQLERRDVGNSSVRRWRELDPLAARQLVALA